MNDVIVVAMTSYTR